jgi:predicted O-methyltransferase YrrM
MEFSNPQMAQTVAEYEQRHREEIARMAALPGAEVLARRDEFLLPVGTDVAGLLHALVLARKPRTILELGTSYGYSTLFLAHAAAICGARVISIDLAADKQAYARTMLERAGLAGHVDLRCGDALELVAREPGPFDFVLLDIWKDLYVPGFEAVYPKLSEEGLIASDNMIQPAGARPNARALRAAINAKPDLQTMLLPVGQGVELTVKLSAGNAGL